MKVGIITFHRADNYGAMLQAFALMSTIEEMGHDVALIDYRSSSIEDFYKYCYIPKQKDPYRFVRGFITNLKWTPKLRKKSKKCDLFRDKYYHLSKSVTTDTDREKIEEEYDLIITGSDQIWRSSITQGKDDWYAFKRTNHHSVIVSYAASAGSLYDFRHYYKLYKTDLESYDMISVREKNLCDFLSDRLDIAVKVVSDPTLLLDANFWNGFIDKKAKRKRPYLFYYDVSFNRSASIVVKRIATQKNMDVVYFNKIAFGNYSSSNNADADPFEFINLLYHADYIVTSSFHATVFSIIFQKRFISFLHPSTGDRTKSLLYSLGLEERMIENEEEFTMSILEKSTDWNNVNEILNEMQSSSREYLEKCFSLVKKQEK